MDVVDSSAMLFVSSFIKIRSLVLKLLLGD